MDNQSRRKTSDLLPFVTVLMSLDVTTPSLWSFQKDFSLTSLIHVRTELGVVKVKTYTLGFFPVYRSIGPYVLPQETPR